MTQNRSFEVDEDLFEAGIEGYVRTGGTGSNIWSLKPGEPRKGYFVTDPDADGKAAGDWLMFREINAFEGLRGGVMMLNGLKQFPVYDQRVVVDEDGKRKRTTDTSLDPLISLVVPGKYGKNGRAKAGDTLAINFLEETTDDDGNVEHRHIILKLSGTRGRELLNTWKMQIEAVDGFSLTAFPWTLLVSGQGAAAMLKMKPHRAEGPTDLPEAINIAEVMQEIRDAVEDFVKEVQGDGPAESLTSASAGADADEEANAAFEGNLDEGGGTELDEASEKYEALTDVQLRAALKKGGVSVPPKAARASLIALAAMNLG